MGSDEHRGPLRDLLQAVDGHGPQFFQLSNHMGVVGDLPQQVDFLGLGQLLSLLHGPAHTVAEACGLGKEHFLHTLPPK